MIAILISITITIIRNIIVIIKLGYLTRHNFSHWLFQGLCGTLDRDSRNDLKDQAGQLLCGGNTRRPCPEFIDSWRYVEQEHALNRLQSWVEMKICGIVGYLL